MVYLPEVHDLQNKSMVTKSSKEGTSRALAGMAHWIEC